MDEVAAYRSHPPPLPRLLGCATAQWHRSAFRLSPRRLDWVVACSAREDSAAAACCTCSCTRIPQARVQEQEQERVQGRVHLLDCTTRGGMTHCWQRSASPLLALACTPPWQR